MDNEPPELARRTLAGQQGFNPGNPVSAKRAVIMIDPFSNEKNTNLKSAEELGEYDIFSIFTELFCSLIAQAQFKPDELILANADNI